MHYGCAVSMLCFRGKFVGAHSGYIHSYPRFIFLFFSFALIVFSITFCTVFCFLFFLFLNLVHIIFIEGLVAIQIVVVAVMNATSCAFLLLLLAKNDREGWETKTKRTERFMKFLHL